LRRSQWDNRQQQPGMHAFPQRRGFKKVAITPKK
jgi:hypothetical protein